MSGSLRSAAMLWGFLRAPPADKPPSSLPGPGYKYVWGEYPQMGGTSETEARAKLKADAPSALGRLRTELLHGSEWKHTVNACVSSRKGLLIDTYQLPKLHRHRLFQLPGPCFTGLGRQQFSQEHGTLPCRRALVDP